jgi:hypothetical protein
MYSVLAAIPSLARGRIDVLGGADWLPFFMRSEKLEGDKRESVGTQPIKMRGMPESYSQKLGLAMLLYITAHELAKDLRTHLVILDTGSVEGFFERAINAEIEVFSRRLGSHFES